MVREVFRVQFQSMKRWEFGKENQPFNQYLNVCVWPRGQVRQVYLFLIVTHIQSAAVTND